MPKATKTPTDPSVPIGKRSKGVIYGSAKSKPPLTSEGVTIKLKGSATEERGDANRRHIERRRDASRGITPANPKTSGQ